MSNAKLDPAIEAAFGRTTQTGAQSSGVATLASGLAGLFGRRTQASSAAASAPSIPEMGPPSLGTIPLGMTWEQIIGMSETEVAALSEEEQQQVTDYIERAMNAGLVNM